MTLREHLDAVNAALVTGEYGRIDEHIKAMRAILDESDRFVTRAPVSISPPDERGQSIVTAGPLVDTGLRFVLDPEPDS